MSTNTTSDLTTYKNLCTNAQAAKAEIENLIQYLSGCTEASAQIDELARTYIERATQYLYNAEDSLLLPSGGERNPEDSNPITRSWYE